MVDGRGRGGRGLILVGSFLRENRSKHQKLLPGYTGKDNKDVKAHVFLLLLIIAPLIIPNYVFK